MIPFNECGSGVVVRIERIFLRFIESGMKQLEKLAEQLQVSIRLLFIQLPELFYDQGFIHIEHAPEFIFITS